MNLLEKLDVAQKVLQTIVFKKRFPLAVGWDITYRCNLQCKYCGAWEKKVKELDTKTVLSVIDDLSTMGTKVMKFSGGEPLLREDLGEIIDFCKRKKMRVLINSNGTLFEKEFWKIIKADEVEISLDGPRDIHDAIRGRGVHDKVIKAIEICKDANMNLVLCTVISKFNISHIPYMLDIAKKYKIGIYFQPADQNLSTNSCKDIRSLFSPDEKDYKKVINFLIEEKLKGYEFISHSITGLKHLYHWPNHRNIGCLVSRLIFSIQPDGKTFICSGFPNYQEYLTPVSANIKESFDNLSLPHCCEECWCSSLSEINLLKNLKMDSILSMWKRFNR